MKPLLLALSVATVMPVAMAAPAGAQSSQYRQEVRECNRELRRADSRAEYRSELRECRRELARAQRQDARRDWRTYRSYDWNRYEPGYNTYYADRYYRDGRYYTDRGLTPADRIYRGQDGRYYCRRSDGTTGLIIGAGVGALLGNAIADGRSNLLGTIIGGVAGGAIGRSIDRGDLRCD